MEAQRIDKWLWTMRFFKTRSIATEACKKGRILVGGVQVKPSYTVTTGTVVQVKRPPVTYSYSIMQLATGRLGAKLLGEYMIDITPADELAKLNALRQSGFKDRDPGLGRPTKKERRDLDEFWESSFFDDDFFNEE
ncbi:MAG: RNA-binding S4 domain-containing protein [Paludibacteraceae bacterium]|nr:RNA-binding S4 domain-containing protein [Paludibacteraceae bacterium]